MGKYTISLLNAFLRANKQKRKYDRIVLLLNRNLDKSPTRLTAITRELASMDQALLPLPFDISTDTKMKYEEARSILNEFIEKEFAHEEVHFLITAPFFIGFAAVFPENPRVRKYSIVYDFIPYKIWHLQRIFPDDIYAQHFEIFIKADHLFTISEAVRNDLIHMFGLPSGMVTSIDGGPFNHAKTTTTALNLNQPYILFPSAPIVHKNNYKAVQAFKRFNALHGNRYHLYVTSTFDQQTKRRMKEIDASINFTGNISDADLSKAYDGAEAVFFPSLAEGLGMPVLEGVLHNVPVACSDIPVLSELSADAFYQFDPTDIDDMVTALTKAVTKEAWQKRKIAYMQLKKRYTWEHSARKLLDRLGSRDQHSEYAISVAMPNPSQDDAAARLGELLYARIRKECTGSILFPDKAKASCPSYAAYLARPKGQGEKLIIATKKSPRFFSRNKEVLIEITNASRRRQSRRTLKVRRVVYDEALQLRGWQYRDINDNILTVDELFSQLLELKD
jgi:glycosyltransferase involved in cell wall biosynthesis